jgi:hypothetical protein
MKSKQILDRDDWAFLVQDDNPLNVADFILKKIEEARIEGHTAGAAERDRLWRLKWVQFTDDGK